MRSVFHRISVIISILIVSLGIAGGEKLYGMPWSRDLYNQKHIKPQEAVRSAPKQTVSPSDPPRRYKRQEEYLKLVNPNPSTKKSILRGKKLFGLICIACHGADGMGETPVSDKFLFPPPLPEIVPERADGELYSQIYFGGDPMPAYAANLSPGEVWDIINFLRTL